MTSDNGHARLDGRRIVVTRADEGPGGLGDRLAALGAEVISVPLTRIEPVNPGLLREALSRLADFSWVVFTSRNAVRITAETLRSTVGSVAALRDRRIAAVGSATAEALAAEGVEVTVTPDRFLAEGVLEALASRDDVRGTRVLYPVAEGARDVLPEGLAALGAEVETVHIYRSAPDPRAGTTLRTVLSAVPPDLVTFAAGSAVRAWVDAVGREVAQRIPAASIGSITSEAARAAGIPVAVEAEESTIGGLVAAISHHYIGRHG